MQKKEQREARERKKRSDEKQENAKKEQREAREQVLRGCQPRSLLPNASRVSSWCRTDTKILREKSSDLIACLPNISQIPSPKYVFCSYQRIFCTCATKNELFAHGTLQMLHMAFPGCIRCAAFLHMCRVLHICTRTAHRLF
jgi:hypothetical protein